MTRRRQGAGRGLTGRDQSGAWAAYGAWPDAGGRDRDYPRAAGSRPAVPDPTQESQILRQRVAASLSPPRDTEPGNPRGPCLRVGHVALHPLCPAVRWEWAGAHPGWLLADFLRQRRVLGTAPVRKFFSALRMLLPAAFLVAVPYLGRSSTVAVVLLTLALTTIGMTGAGININHVDIAPGYAGFLPGITNIFGIVAGIIVPTAAGLLISQVPRRLQQFLLLLFGLIFHKASGSGTIQERAKEDPAVEREPWAWQGARGDGQHLQPPLPSS